jgi:hypothetical protein
MRSYTSLISHILGNNKDISGYAEMHQSYRWSVELIYLDYIVFKANNNCLDGIFVLDKILHNYCIISNRIINKNNVKIVFLLRKPQETLKSIINLGKNVVDYEWFCDVEAVSSYYRKRLQQIAIYGKKAGKKAIYFDAERIISDTDRVLEKLSEKLNLSQPLNKEYGTFKYTGAPDFGDPTDNIKQGKILTHKNKYTDIKLPPGIITDCEEAYIKCRNTMLHHCDCI